MAMSVELPRYQPLFGFNSSMVVNDDAQRRKKIDQQQILKRKLDA